MRYQFTNYELREGGEIPHGTDREYFIRQSRMSAASHLINEDRMIIGYVIKHNYHRNMDQIWFKTLQIIYPEDEKE